VDSLHSASRIVFYFLGGALFAQPVFGLLQLAPPFTTFAHLLLRHRHQSLVTTLLSAGPSEHVIIMTNQEGAGANQLENTF
jgi:hypothetical protein